MALKYVIYIGSRDILMVIYCICYCSQDTNNAGETASFYSRIPQAWVHYYTEASFVLF